MFNSKKLHDDTMRWLSQNSLVMFYTTLPSVSTAENMAKILLKEKLVGCVNILPKMISLYLWEGNIEQKKEIILLAKSMKGEIPHIRTCVQDHHPYDIPALLFFPVNANYDYKTWIKKEIDQ